jgi:hypothetical protein
MAHFFDKGSGIIKETLVLILISPTNYNYIFNEHSTSHRQNRWTMRASIAFEYVCLSDMSTKNAVSRDNILRHLAEDDIEPCAI